MSTQVASPISPQDRNELMGVYKTMFETWRSQVDSYWQRSSYFAVFETAAVSGCWILVSGSRLVEILAGLALSILGTLLTVVWHYSNKKTHTYVRHWWDSVRKIEARLNLAPNDFAEQLTQAQEIRHQRDGGIQYRDLIQRVPLLFGIAWAVLFLVAVGRASNPGSKASVSPTPGTSLTTNPAPSGSDVVANPGFQTLDEPIEPFETGSTVRLEGQPAYQKTICDSDKVKALIEKAKDKRLRLLVVIGSADKFELTQPLKRIYGSNDGLAQGRADQILSCLSKNVVSEASLTSIRGPSVHGSSASKAATGKDRSVEVYGSWIEDQASQHVPDRPPSVVGKGVLSSLLNSLRGFWEYVKSREPPWYSAIGTWVAAFFAAFIGVMALRINANTVRGQRIHEQIRMVLETDRELIRDPELRGIFDADKVALPAGSTPDAATEFKKKMLVYSYLNMFDFVQGFYARRLMWILLWPRRDREDWAAWKNYMENLFKTSSLSIEVWREAKKKGMYSKSFIRFMDEHVVPQ
jgi:hypothetical protein